MATKSFDLRTEPHEATIGDDVWHFVPEVDSDQMLRAWAHLMISEEQVAQAVEANGWSETEAKSRLGTEGLKSFLLELMVPEDHGRFIESKYPDRIYLDMERWLLEIHGLRPTGPSNDS